LATLSFANGDRDGLVVHEWGTFTSVQGGDGVLLPWHASQIGELPKFVHDWMKPGLNRRSTSMLFTGKGGLTTLQRMETPVIYFYSDTETTAEVTVRFPKGLITEWYPQAAEIGPSVSLTNDAITATKENAANKESLIHWRDVRVLPSRLDVEMANRLPTDTNGTHYFSARETDAAFVRVNDLSPTNPADEHERFLFYRGSGSFSTPLVVTSSDDGTVSIDNTGAAPLAHLFLLQVRDGAVEWTHLEKLEPHARQTWQKLNSVPASERRPVDQVRQEVGVAMADALASTGLFPTEARAMVKTWDKAWFGEDGVRVLYILPHGWTDEILPLQLNPRPRELVRLMVGRAEIIMPETQKELAGQIALAKAGNAAAKQWLQNYSKKFGRFAPPAFQLANNYLSRQPNKPIATAAWN
jgi:hypothetical protein